MIRRIHIAAILLITTTVLAHAAEVIDRIVANVNNRIILQSEWDEALAYEALTGGKPLQQVSEQDRKAALDRLIDQQLLLEQFPPSEETAATYHPDAKTLASRIQDVRKQFNEAATDQGWRDLLGRYGFTEDTLRERIANQLEILHMVDERLTPTLQLTDQSIADYYHQTFLPELRKNGAKEPPLSEVAPRIRELLLQQQLNDALKELLQSLRDGSTIRLLINSSNGSPAR